MEWKLCAADSTDLATVIRAVSAGSAIAFQAQVRSLESRLFAAYPADLTKIIRVMASGLFVAIET
jgi:hypothetical protein